MPFLPHKTKLLDHKLLKQNLSFERSAQSEVVGLCTQLKVNIRFRVKCRLHLQDWRVSQVRIQYESKYNLEDEGDIFLWNVDWITADYTKLYLKKRAAHNHCGKNLKSYFSLTVR
jgi:hypothetical protein